MAIQEQLNILQQGAKVWNTWRKQQPETLIDLSGADFTNAFLYGVNFSEANLSRAILFGASLLGANLTGADLSEANLIRADLSTDMYDKTKLNKINLSKANLSDANFNASTLSEANLSEANLTGATLIGAWLYEANLSKADLTNANLYGADLTRANLTRTNLRGANLARANLSGTDLGEAKIGWTVLGNLDLRLAKGIETVKHDAPSTIGTNTLEQSKGDIPEIFLKGAGLSDMFITYTRSLVQSPIQYYTCFLSYSSKDELFARRLHNDLQQEGIRCWFAPEDLDIGDKIRQRIEESIRLYDKLLLVLSKHSIASMWVAYEVEKALNKEPKGTPNVLYPVRVDQTILSCKEPWAQEIKETRHIGNFEHWTDPEQYQDNFKRLLRALNSKEEHKR